MSDPKRIVIVGGVAGGASAAARARRLSEDAQITIFERGEYISFANCGLPYYIGGEIAERERLLVQTPEAMRKRFRIDVRINTEVVGIDRENKQVVARGIEHGVETHQPYDELIISPGADPIKPPLPGINSDLVHTLRNLADTDAIKELVDQKSPSRVVVVGGGYIGLEMAEALINRGIKVTLVEMMEQVMGPVDPEMAYPIHQCLRLHGVDLRLKTSVDGFSQDGETLHVKLSTGEVVECGLAVLAIGVRPEVKLAKDAGLNIGERGGIAVDKNMRTNDPHIFAVGDAVEVTDFVSQTQALIPLAGPANRQGRIAADNAFGRNSEYKDTQGTAICKIFELAIGMTGMSEKLAKKLNRNCEKVYIHPASHAGYYPGAHPISLKLLFDPEDGKILGVQAVGADGVDKRIDVIAVAIRAGLTVYDLEEMELCYAPPFGSAKDPVNYAGFVAANVLKGDSSLCHVPEIINPTENQIVIDVRNPQEVETGMIPKAENIPLDELRDRLDEIPKDKELLVYCQAGLRGYLACRILSQKGFTCKNLTGGYKTYKAFMEIADKEQLETKEMRDDTGSAPPSVGKKELPESPVQTIDAVGLQCPGPIMKLKEVIDSVNPGEMVTLMTSDPGAPGDIGGWANSTGNKLINVEIKNGVYHASVLKTAKKQGARVSTKKKSIIVFSGDFDKAMAAFIIANGAASMGSEVTLFFTFWGLNVLRRPEEVKVSKNLIESMFGKMMPRGAGKLSLSNMNMGGMGTKLIKSIMKQKNVDSLPLLIEKAQKAGVRLVACAMSMDLMGIKKEELIDGVEFGGVASYLNTAEEGNVNLFI